jgi:hypothetical protein
MTNSNVVMFSVGLRNDGRRVLDRVVPWSR